MSMVSSAADAMTGTVLERALADLRARVRGQLLLPGDPAYEESRRVWNAMIDRRPAIILRCLGTADVLVGIAFARDNQLPISIKGGGHNIAGLALCDGGIMLDMGLMRGVRVDTQARTAWAQAGCLLGDVDRETQLHGLAAPLGFVSNTGIAGLTLGGGFGYLTRQYGWTCDHVTSMEVVTADGRIVRASERENPDLFWGLRGGGGNFGVVTAFEYALKPLGPEIVGGARAWPIDQSDGVIELYRRMTADAPPEATYLLLFRPAPPAPWLPKEVHGTPVAMILACHIGPIAEAEKHVAPIKSFGKPVGDVIQRRPFTVQQALLDATQPKGRRYYWKSEFLPALTSEMIEGCRTHAASIPSPHSAVILFPIDGALNELPVDHSAVGNRDARLVLNITSAWESPDADAPNIAWARTAWQDLRRFSTGGTYINFQTADESEDRVRAAYGDNYDRLAEIKAKWDPTNLFRMNKNIQPGTT